MSIDIPLRCTVCGRLTSTDKQFSNRLYCDQHYEMFTEDVLPVWRSSVLTFALMVIMAATIGISAAVLKIEFEGNLRLIVSLAIAVIPALAWLFFLYSSAQRRGGDLSPLLPTIFVLAALIAAALTRPLLFELLELDLWLTRTNAINRFAGNILIAGAIHGFALYAIIRYTVWRTPTFEHRVDGIMFSLASGWGYASMMNALFVLDQGGLTLLNGGMHTLAHFGPYLSASLIIGYFLGRNRFEDLPFYYLTAGMVLAMIVNGMLLYAANELNVTRLRITADGFAPWPGFIANMLTLVLVYAGIYGLLRRHNKLTRARIGLDE
jgi:RsiW-degrading membrane proteinase PrsW (M82 family)